jgi:hypothetical protein
MKHLPRLKVSMALLVGTGGRHGCDLQGDRRCEKMGEKDLRREFWREAILRVP